MLRYALGRLIGTVPVLFGVTLLVFLMAWVTPGERSSRCSARPRRACRGRPSTTCAESSVSIARCPCSTWLTSAGSPAVISVSRSARGGRCSPRSATFAILAIAGLSFLGLGVQPPVSDWGEMLARGRRYLPDATWLMFFPGFVVSLTVLGFNLLGDALRDALDPKG